MTNQINTVITVLITEFKNFSKNVLIGQILHDLK